MHAAVPDRRRVREMARLSVCHVFIQSVQFSFTFSLLDFHRLHGRQLKFAEKWPNTGSFPVITRL